MDDCEYLDQFLYSPSWSDVDLRQRLSGLSYEEENNNSNSTSVINANRSSVESLAAQDGSLAVLSSELDYGNNVILHQGAAQLQDHDRNFLGNPANGMVNGGSKPTKLSCSYNTAAPMSGNVSSSSLSYLEMANTQCNSLEPSVFQSFNKDFRTISQIPHLSHLPSYDGVSWESPGLGRDGVGGFGSQGEEYMDNDLYSVENHSSNYHTSVSSKDDLQSYSLPSFASRRTTTTTTNGLQSLSQITTAAPPGECNGTGKPRVRARRGQATDPHSIAERLRREKIADRMKNLQELLPSPNKSDKASMLDEIIEYVKFLQLQVKVLSMSRLGAAGAVVPLITDCHAEGGNGLLLSPTSGKIDDIVFPSEEVEFERELVKMLESNVTKAMQFLQTKGLCLMPVALASAMSPRKEKENGAHRMPLNGNAIARNPNAEESNSIMVRSDGGNKISLIARDEKPRI